MDYIAVKLSGNRVRAISITHNINAELFFDTAERLENALSWLEIEPATDITSFADKKIIKKLCEPKKVCYNSVNKSPAGILKREEKWKWKNLLKSLLKIF